MSTDNEAKAFQPFFQTNLIVGQVQRTPSIWQLCSIERWRWVMLGWAGFSQAHGSDLITDFIDRASPYNTRSARDLKK